MGTGIQMLHLMLRVQIIYDQRKSDKISNVIVWRKENYTMTKIHKDKVAGNLKTRELTRSAAAAMAARRRAQQRCQIASSTTLNTPVANPLKKYISVLFSH